MEPVSTDDVRAALAALAALAAELERDSPRTHGEEDLRRAFRAGRSAPPRRSRRAWPLVLAAAGLAAVGFALMRPATPPPSPAAATAAEADLVFALRPGESALDLEGGQLVRVRVSSDVLRAMGVAVGDRAAADVEADVLVGYDGVARAVRVARSGRVD